MPFISTEEVREIRNNLKKALPEFKFSVRKQDHCAVTVTVVSGPELDLETNNTSINHFWYKTNYEDNQKMIDLIEKILNTIDTAKPQREVVYDSDYGSVPNYYKNIQIGDYNKPYIVKG